MKSKRCRNYVFTLNNPVSEEDAIRAYFGSSGDCSESPRLCSFLCYGREKGDSGTPHLQGYLELSRAVSISALSKAMPFMYRAHLEARRGSQEEAIRYCEKDGDFVQFGDRKSQGGRSDLDAIRESIASGERTVREIADSSFSLWCIYRRSFEAYSDMLAANARTAPYEPVAVSCYWGKTGTGKTRRAFEENPGLYSWPGGLWFDGYVGQSVLLLDEFDGSQIPFRELLRILDRYPLQVPVKGGYKHAQWKKVIITSNKEASQWYPFEDYAPLQRRITETIEFK